MANTFKKVIDRLMWVQTTPAPNIHATGMSMCSDLRSDASRNPYVYQLASATVLNRFNIVTKAWQFTLNPALVGTFGAGASTVFAPSQGLKGAIGVGSTASSIVTTTAMTAVGVNMLANRGGSGEFGFKIRIVGKVAGKTEERWIVGNSAGTTPKFTLDKPLTFTPVAGDRYEILSGRIFMLNAGTVASNSWRSYEIASNALSSGLSTTGLPATVGTDTALIALDEQYTPYDCEPGEGFIKGGFVYDENLTIRHALAATAASSTTLTGQASSGDAEVLANEYRNFQIRIVQDLVNPSAVDQRAIIASHTAGPSAVYTLGAAWAVAPSAEAKFVIEYPNLILARSSASTNVYVWNYNDATVNNGTNSIAANAWTSAYFAAAPANNALGCMWAPCYGIRPDADKNARHSFLYFFRGQATTLDRFDLAGGTSGAWTSAVPYDGATTITTGSCGSYAPFENEGRFFYMNIYASGATNQIFRFDVQNSTLAPMTATEWLQSGTAAAGQRMAAYCAIDGRDKYDVIMLMTHGSTISQELITLI